MTPKPFLMLLSLAVLVSGPATAAEDTVYVTDELRLGLYEGEATSGRPTRMLTSGDQLQILDRALRSARVRTEDGDEGWVKTGYIVTQAPARRLIKPLQADNETLTEALDAMSTDKAAMQQRITRLSGELEKARQVIVTLPNLESELADLRQAVAASASSVHLNWLIAAAAAAFITGCWAGYFWLDRRVRKRFGGLRVY